VVKGPCESADNPSVGHGPRAAARIPDGVVVGAKSVLRAVHAPRPIVRIIVAADAPAEATEPVRRLAGERAVPLIEVLSSIALGERYGIGRPVAAAAELARAAVGTKVPA